MRVSLCCSPARPIFDPTYHIQRNNLAVCLLDLAQLGNEVPEPRLSNDIIHSEDAHAVELRSRVGIRRQVAANDLVFLKTT